MFGARNMATPLLPAGQQAVLCPYNYYSGCYNFRSCWYAYYSGGCGWGYWSYCHYAISITPTIEQAQLCPAATNPCLISPDPTGQGTLGDPVQQLQALRQQLEVTLAGVRAQEEELLKQRAAQEGPARGRGAQGA